VHFRVRAPAAERVDVCWERESEHESCSRHVVRHRRPRGTPALDLDPPIFVNYLQNHVKIASLDRSDILATSASERSAMLTQPSPKPLRRGPRDDRNLRASAHRYVWNSADRDAAPGRCDAVTIIPKRRAPGRRRASWSSVRIRVDSKAIPLPGRRSMAAFQSRSVLEGDNDTQPPYFMEETHSRRRGGTIFIVFLSAKAVVLATCPPTTPRCGP
jgi:hypothetical protein